MPDQAPPPQTTIPTLPPTDNESVLIAKIQQIEAGSDTQSPKTIIITIDRGSKDGVYEGQIGYVRIYVNTVMEFMVQSVSFETATLYGWDYPTIKLGDKVVFFIDHVPDSLEETLEYFQ